MRTTVRSQNGFTLLEVLVAVTVAVLLLTGIYGVFTSVSGAKQRLEMEGEVYHQARVLYDRLGRELRGAYWRKTAKQTRFMGGRTGDDAPFLELTTTAGTPFGGGRGGISVVRYELLPDREAREPDAWVLMRSEYSTFDPDGGDREGYRLATGIRELNFRFYKNGKWETEWDAARDGLPQIVEVSITLPVGERPVPFRSSFDVAIQ
jgi:general secretion pathway protein J